MIEKHDKLKLPIITCGLYLYNKVNKSILACHATHASYKTWSIPKGLKEEGEDPYGAATRELQEETGIDLEKTKPLSVHPLPLVSYKKQSKILQAFLVIIDEDLSAHKFHCSSLINNEFPEVDNWKWISPSVVDKYLHESQLENMEMVNAFIQENN
jgi:8-oxo-dGTP pyrophosphatase MutT (NUDIX family)